MPAKTIVYVDGFNFYYGAVKGKGLHWLNLEAFCRLLLPQNDIVAIKYFTAIVEARPDDPHKVERQRAYLRALTSLSKVEVIFGSFITSTKKFPLAAPVPGGPKFVEVLKTEEKGSDVNLATHLLVDAVRHKMDVAAVVSNDTDLMLPMDMAMNEFGVKVGLLNPHRYFAVQFQGRYTFQKKIRSHALKSSQFPDIVDTPTGPVHKPQKWRTPPGQPRPKP
jgi:hypothetical protein